MKSFLLFLVVISMIFTGCSPKNELASDEENQTEQQIMPTISKTEITETLPQHTPTMTILPTEILAENQSIILSPEPINLQIESFDGILLDAIYYPAEINPAPLLILFHQINFDQNEWKVIAPWLQNRGLLMSINTAPGNPLARPKPMDAGPWFDPTWFPTLPESFQVAVLTVTFRSCENGCEEFFPEEWVKDAAATIDFGSKLEGIDPEKIITIGTSIGADAAIDSCLNYFEESNNSCLAALSASPGSYLNIPFDETVKKLTDNSTKVLCYSGVEDLPSYQTCLSVNPETKYFSTHFVPGQYHGIYGVDPNVEIPWIIPMIDLIVEVLQ